jgi:hypothetical protein
VLRSHRRDIDALHQAAAGPLPKFRSHSAFQGCVRSTPCPMACIGRAIRVKIGSATTTLPSTMGLVPTVTHAHRKHAAMRANSGFCYVYFLKGARPVWRHEDLCAVDLLGRIGVNYLHKVRRPTGYGVMTDTPSHPSAAHHGPRCLTIRKTHSIRSSGSA